MPSVLQYSAGIWRLEGLSPVSIIRFAAARAVFKPFVSSDAPIVNAMSLDFADKNVWDA